MIKSAATVIFMSLYSISSHASPLLWEENDFSNKAKVLETLNSLPKKNIAFDAIGIPALHDSLAYIISYLKKNDTDLNISAKYLEDNKTDFYASWTAFTNDESNESYNFALTWFNIKSH